MGVPGDALLSQKVNLLRQSTDYQLLLSTVAALYAQAGQSLPENALAPIADAVLRPIATDLSSVAPGCKVMLHIFVAGE